MQFPGRVAVAQNVDGRIFPAHRRGEPVIGASFNAGVLQQIAPQEVRRCELQLLRGQIKIRPHDVGNRIFLLQYAQRGAVLVHLRADCPQRLLVQSRLVISEHQDDRGLLHLCKIS